MCCFVMVQLGIVKVKQGQCGVGSCKGIVTFCKVLLR